MKTISFKKLLPKVILVQLLVVNVGEARTFNAGQTSARELMLSRQIGFIENKGQIADAHGNLRNDVLFKMPAPGVDIYITTKGISYYFKKINKEEEKKDEIDHSIFSPHEDGNTEIQWCRLDMLLKGAKIGQSQVSTAAPQSDYYANYYLGHCPRGILEVRKYNKIIISNIYPGIDWVIYATGQYGSEAIKYDFIVHPGADPGRISLTYTGPGVLGLTTNQGLQFSTPLGVLQDGELYAYEQKSGKEVALNYRTRLVSTELLSDNEQESEPVSVNAYEVKFGIAPYDSKQSLVIDPVVVWATYVGGLGLDGPYDMAIDAAGNTYISGYEGSSDMPVEDPGDNAYYFETIQGNDAFIWKFSNSGVMLWSTFYGGDGSDFGYALTVDKDDNLILVGSTSSATFPIVNPGNGAYIQTYSSGNMSFISKFNKKGVLTWSTQFGSGFSDIATDVTTDANGDIYIIGQGSSGGPTIPTKNPGNGAYFQPTITGFVDLFIVQFSNAGEMKWATYYGGTDYDSPDGIAASADGRIYIIGTTSSNDLPLQDYGQGAYYQDYNASQLSTFNKGDLFILEFNPQGVRQMATYYGGTGYDVGYGCTVDAEGSVYFTGSTQSIDFPLKDQGNGAYYQDEFLGGVGVLGDAFILKLNANNQRVWSTFYGGVGGDGAYCITTDQGGNLYLAGETTSADLPMADPGCGSYKQNLVGGTGDMFVSKFTASGALYWGTFYGAASWEFARGIAVDKNLNLFLTGEWSNYYAPGIVPTVDPGNGAYYQQLNAGIDDGFMMKFAPSGTPPAVLAAPGNPEICPGNSVSLSASGADSYTWFPATGLSSATGATVTANPSQTTTYTVTGTTTDGCSNTATVTVTVLTSPKAIYTYSKDSFTVQFTGDTSNGVYQWFWDFGDRSVTSTDQSPEHTYEQNETFTVTLIVWNQCGTDTITFDITIDGSNGQGGNTGINEKSAENEMSVYPNPFTRMLNIDFYLQQPSKIKMEVFDVLGRMIYQYSSEELTAAGAQHYVLTENSWMQNEGIYYLKLSSGNQTRYCRLIKSN